MEQGDKALCFKVLNLIINGLPSKLLNDKNNKNFKF